MSSLGKLLKNDGFETKRFYPQFDKVIPNVSTFRGHNSSGKSTFMDLVALTFHGRSSSEVISKLKEKLDYLHDADNSDFTFNISVDNNAVLLRAETKKVGYIDGSGQWDCIIEESLDGGKTFTELTKERFLKKYRVIYDMPDRPMERVQELVREAERITYHATESVDSFRSILNDVLHEAENSRNEELIFFLKNEIEKQNELKSDYEDSISQAQKLSKKMNQLYYSMELTDLFSEKEKICNKISNLKKTKSDKEKAVIKENKEYDSNVRTIKNHLKKMIENYMYVCNRIDRISVVDEQVVGKYLDYRDMNPDMIFNMNCSQLYSFREVSKQLISEVESNYKDSAIESMIDKKNLLGELVTALEPYVQDNMRVLDSPVSTLYDKLSNEYEDICNTVSNYEKVREVVDHAKEAFKLAKSAESKFDDLGDRPVNESTDSGVATVLNGKHDAIQKQISSTLDAAMFFQVNADNYSRIYDQCSEDILLKEYLSYTKEELQKKSSEFSRDVESLEGKIQDVKDRIADLKRELEDAESKEKHPLSDYQDELRELNARVQDMIKEFKSKCSILDSLSKNESVQETESNCTFLENVWKYLGQRLGTVQHIGTKYQIDKINMNDHEIIAGEVHINFKDMGTGESQLAYLTGLLNSDDDRITIALFDEIDHMDPNIISKIQKQLSELYKRGKLLMGIMAAPGTGVEVIPYE